MTISDLRFDDNGLVPVVVQQHDTGAVLMLAYMNAEAIRRTLAEGRAVYWSRSRQEYWRKGDTSGNTQTFISLHTDCDGDALLLRVDQSGVACHTGTLSCFDDSRLVSE